MTQGEREAIYRMIDAANMAGWSLTRASDGEDSLRYFKPSTGEVRTVDQLIEHAAACEQGWLYFQHATDADVRQQCVFLVFGNAPDGSEIVADHSTGESFGAESWGQMMDAWSAAEELHYAGIR